MPVSVPGPAGAAGAAGTASIPVYDEGAVVGTATIINAVGAGIAATYSSGTAILTVSGGAGDGFTVITSSADEDATNVSGATQDHTELQFATTAGKKYMIDMLLMVSGSDATGDFAFRFAVAAGTLSGRAVLTNPDTGLSPATTSIAASAAANTGSVNVGTPADATFPTLVGVRFAFLASDTTTFKLQFGNVTAGVGRISRVFKGSVLKYKQTD